MHMELRHSAFEQFWVVFTISEEDSFVHEDFCEELFRSRAAAEEYAAQQVEEDNVSRIVVHCIPVASVTVPKPVVQVKEIGSASGLPPGVKAPPKPKGVVK